MTRTGMQLPVVRQTFGMDLGTRKQVSLVSKEPRTLRSCMVPSTAGLSGQRTGEAIKASGKSTAAKGLFGSPTSDGSFLP